MSDTPRERPSEEARDVARAFRTEVVRMFGNVLPWLEEKRIETVAPWFDAELSKTLDAFASRAPRAAASGDAKLASAIAALILSIQKNAPPALATAILASAGPIHEHQALAAELGEAGALLKCYVALDHYGILDRDGKQDERGTCTAISAAMLDAGLPSRGELGECYGVVRAAAVAHLATAKGGAALHGGAK